MNYITAWTDALTFHRDLPFIPLHCTYVTFTSPPRLTSLHLTSLHFTTLHFTSLITFLILFLKLLGLQERVLCGLAFSICASSDGDLYPTVSAFIYIFFGLTEGPTSYLSVCTFISYFQYLHFFTQNKVLCFYVISIFVLLSSEKNSFLLSVLRHYSGDVSVGIAIPYGLEGLRFSPPWGTDFRTRPHRRRGPLKILYNKDRRSSPGDKSGRAWPWPPTPPLPPTLSEGYSYTSIPPCLHGVL
jgi:hypothetical protein